MEQSRGNFRILTLNTHSLMEADNEAAISAVADAIIKEHIDFAALQEVNQSRTADETDAGRLKQSGFLSPDKSFPIREDNYGLTLSELLRKMGYPSFWSWAFAHRGYRIYEEGVMILSKHPLSAAAAMDISASEEGDTELCRRSVLGAQFEAGLKNICVYSTHLGWWDDKDDPSAAQIDRMDQFCRQYDADQIFAAGDFNSPAAARGEGRDRMLSLGWMDCYTEAAEKDDGMTVPGAIDGWRSEKASAIRIDYCFSKKPVNVLKSTIIFDGKNYPVVSDHFGVLTEINL